MKRGEERGRKGGEMKHEGGVLMFTVRVSRNLLTPTV